jgi:thymidylate kinase
MSSNHLNETGAPTEVPPPAARPQRPTPPDRAEVLAAVVEAATRTGRRWAWQGSVDAGQRWIGETGPKDLDLWCEGRGAGHDDPVVAFGRAVTCAKVVDANRPGRLRHVILAAETATGVAVVDFDFGDLLVGPVLLVPADEIDADHETRRLVGAAAVADLLVRPLLRGRAPDRTRMVEATEAWRATGPTERTALVERLRHQLGARVTGQILDALAGAAVDPMLPRRTRAWLLVRSLAPANIAATWAERATVVPAGRAAGPLGLRTRGVVVAVIGTDGSGKTTVTDELDERLRRFGMATGSAYFGMGRGNLPGVRLARRAVGALRSRSRARSGATLDPTAPIARDADLPGLRRAAAWFYAAEYVWRYLRYVRPQRRSRRVVIVDRWVYDLRESPWPGSAAAEVIRRIVPSPDIVVLPDAPVAQIHARKPERPIAEQAAEQGRYRRLLAERPARYAELIIDTSGATADPLAPLVAVVIEAAHRPNALRRIR